MYELCDISWYYVQYYSELNKRENVNSEASVIDVIVREYSPGVWAWKRKDKRKYKREEARRKILRDDLDATRDCIVVS